MMLADISQSDPDYLDWILNKDFSEQVKQVIREARSA